MQPISHTQNSIMVGGVLGDMHVQKNDKSTKGNCRLRFSHNLKQEKYIQWKYKAFKQEFCRGTKGIHKETLVRQKGTYTSCLFYTERRPEFNEMHEKWYTPITSISKGVVKTNYVKTIPADLDKILTDPLALAVWYLDDGTKRADTQSCRIATQGFSKEGHEIISACLFQNFGVRSKIESWGRNKAGEVNYQIAILSSKRTGDYDKFRDLLYPIVKAEMPSLLYKLQ